jgi:hypothetical protein
MPHLAKFLHDRIDPADAHKQNVFGQAAHDVLRELLVREQFLSQNRVFSLNEDHVSM